MLKLIHVFQSRSEATAFMPTGSTYITVQERLSTCLLLKERQDEELKLAHAVQQGI